MNRSGCKNCPVKPCETLYRGSICLSRRHKLGLGDPMTNADRIRSLNDEELAEFLIDLADDGNLRIRDWLQQTTEEADHVV